MGVLVGALGACAISEPAGGGDSLEGAVPSVGTPGRLRLMAGNITSGNKQAYEGPGIRIFRAMNPDVAMIQEFNYQTNSAADLRSFIDQAFGADYVYARGAASQQIPNGIVSRYPILESGEWKDTAVGNRQFTWARIDIPGSIDLYAISVHLLSSSSASRDTEARLLVQNILALPSNAYVVLGGDFNTGSRSEACIQTLASALSTGAPYPVDQAGLGNTNANRNKPYDWVLGNASLTALEQPVVVGASQFAHGLVVDTRVYAPISDLAPALTSDSGATNMQHMAVVRDFAISGGTPPATVQVTAPNGGETWPAGSAQTIAWSATNVTDVRVELTTDGATWTTLAASTPAAAGQLSVTVPATATTAARVRVTALPSGAPVDASDAAFTITAGPPPVARVFINEVLANEPGSTVAGEFVEIVNSGTAAADLSGWTISDGTAVRHVFAAGTTLGAGRAIVVFAAASGIPGGLTNAIASSTGSFSFGNSGDTVTLAAPSGTIDTLTYTAALAAVDGVSMNRSTDGDPGASFVLHTVLTAAQRSPGTRASGAAF